jgi:hypothetical protein
VFGRREHHMNPQKGQNVDEFGAEEPNSRRINLARLL